MEERAIRIGKDFNVRWSINKVVDGERQPYELAGKELVLQYRTPYGLKEATEWKVVGNTIVWTFRGKEQKALGSYELILTENGGKDGMVTVDTCRAFKLVAHSCEETEGSGSDIVIEDVVLEGEVAFAALRGPQGEQGPAGPQGPQGERGPEGPQGPAGPSYNDTEIKGKLAELSESKQDNIVDLDSIRSGASKGSTSEQTINKTTSLSSASTDTQYPSAKAVFTAISNAKSGKQGVISQTQTWTQAADKGYDYAISNIVRGVTPQANIDLLASVGIVFNAGSGYFELNGMTDLSYEEAMAVYSKTSAFSQGNISPSGVGLGGVIDKTYVIFRCNVPVLPFRLYMMTQVSFSYLCWNNRFIERLFLCNYNPVFAKEVTSAFENCYRLKEVQGVIELKNSATNYASAFLNCYSLELISLQSIKANLNFAQSARLSNASILFMINKEVATSAITITLHADAYARAMADAEITAALAAHPNVSLAKA